jgi:hypothetical protein
MVLGDLQAWANRFITADERLLERIWVLWPKCMAVLPSQPTEDQITINLVHLLGKDEVVRRICHWVEFQFEPFGTASNGAKFSKGKIDIAVLLDWERERYLAYECKRLNVTNGGIRSSLATPYVTQGMMRFLTEQYAEGLPIGCMLGYIIDGDIPFAVGQIHNAIAAHQPLSLVAGPTAATPLQGIERFVTTHKRAANVIELRHALLPFSARSARPNQAIRPFGREAPILDHGQSRGRCNAAALR